MYSIRVLCRLWMMAVQVLIANKVRSIFSIVAVSLSIAALTVITASIQGAEKKAEEIVSAFGSDAILIFSGALAEGAMSTAQTTLTQKDIAFIMTNAQQIKYIVPMRTLQNIAVRYQQKNAVVATLVGTTAEYTKAWRWNIVQGVPLTQADIQKSENVVVLGETVRKKLFPDGDAVGKRILVNNTMQCTVVGVLEERSIGGLYDVNDTILIPVTTLEQRFHLERNVYDSVRILLSGAEYVKVSTNNIRAMLRYTHTLNDGDKDNFTIITPEEVLRFMSFVKGGIAVFLTIAAVGALMVGGFVLANLFYVSVIERTVEIGLKKALGASTGSIIVQFLMEVSLLALMGALGGIALGYYIGFVLEKLDIISIDFSWNIFLFAAIVAWLLGFFFVWRPAKKAARVRPIIALKGDV